MRKSLLYIVQRCIGRLGIESGPKSLTETQRGDCWCDGKDDSLAILIYTIGSNDHILC